jgi:16S rRNA processing protein RimM
MKTEASKNNQSVGQPSDLVIMGRILAPYGVYGWLKINPSTETLDGLFDYETWWIGKDNDWREFLVEEAKIHNDLLVAKLQGIEERDAALACKGKQIAVSRALFPVTNESEYYWSDLIGLQVKNLKDIDFGKIVDVLETGANDVIVVKNESVNSAEIRERLIPFIAQTVLDVSIENKTMLVDWDADF